MESPVTKSMLFDYFAGKSSSLQEMLIKQWLEKPENGEFFYQCLEAWETEKLQYVPDTEKAYQQYMHLLEKGNITYSKAAQTKSLSSIKLHSMQRWMVAACISVLLLAGAIYLAKDIIFYQTYATQFGEIRTFVLDDNSQVSLNANSVLRVPRNFLQASRREVYLTGEAFFSVIRQADHKKFIVHTQDLEVEVLGTKFNVSERRGKTKVILNEGKVKLVSKAATAIQPVLMQPGESVEFTTTEPAFKKKTVKSKTNTSWRENKLIFEETPLVEVMQTIEDFYGIPLILSDTSQRNKKFTSTLPNNNIDIVLNSLSRVYGFEIIKRTDRIILK